ncbi:hypothetical protein FQN60_017656 [Etheostoma spectabile]|uniref:Uncharacterized protein n=1 Tax=Etheostoma spectabile TaxID=54343 RepID=A0A5J5DG12_9PERO|nr:hypothetical protein FQN60_017656 [Etheostoma spectabile]
MATGEMYLSQTYRQPSASIKQEQDDDSDVEETHLGLRSQTGLESQIIHSGHFMVSSAPLRAPSEERLRLRYCQQQTCQPIIWQGEHVDLSIDAS